MKVRVLVRLKPGVLDPQGRAVHHALEGLGFEGVEDVRIGRVVELDVADGTSDAAIDDKLGHTLQARVDMIPTVLPYVMGVTGASGSGEAAGS